MEWLVGRPAGWLVAWLPLCRSVENRPTPIHSSSLFLFLRVLLFVRARVCTRLVFGKCVVCACVRFAEKKKKKKAEGWRRGVLHVLGEVSAKKKFFNARSQVTVEGEGRMGHEILVSALFFFFFRWLAFRFLWSRERNFNCAVVCLVMRIRAPFFSSRSTGNC